MLSEAQIVRYSRQILLHAVGGVGQKRLLSVGAAATGEGSAQAVALAYLASGGTPVSVADRPAARDEVGFLLSADDVGKPVGPAVRSALDDMNPDAMARPAAFGCIGEVPAAFSGPAPWVALGWDGESGVVVYRGEDGCSDCFVRAASELTNGSHMPQSVMLGALAALAYQRLVLGLSASLGALRLERDGAILAAAVKPCGRHGGAS